MFITMSVGMQSVARFLSNWARPDSNSVTTYRDEHLPLAIDATLVLSLHVDLVVPCSGALRCTGMTGLNPAVAH